MPTTNATDAVISSDLPKRQHETYFPIGNDPHLLVEVSTGLLWARETRANVHFIHGARDKVFVAQAT